MENGILIDGTADYKHPMSIEEFRQQAYKMVDFICDYYKNLESVDVLPDVQPGYLRDILPEEAPKQGQSFAEILKDVTTHIIPGMTHWQSPNFFAYFPANSSFPGILGEMLSAAFNIIGFSWRGCPPATDLETVVLDWMAKFMNLPSSFRAIKEDGKPGKGGGCIQCTASDAILVAVVAGRERKMETLSPSDALNLVAYCSDQTQNWAKKACNVAGIQHLRVLKTTGENSWRLQGSDLEKQIQADIEDGLHPFFILAAIGTTSTGTIDPIKEIGEISRKYELWLHVDAAYAGVTAILPEYSQCFEGLDLADSFDANAHKWLLTNFDCSLMFVQDSFYLKKAFTLTPAFLKNTTNQYDYKDWQVPHGRRFRSLKLWFVLRSYGQEGLQNYLRHHISLAKELTNWTEEDERFVIAAQQRFALVCFKLKEGNNEQNKALLEAVNATGKFFIVHTELDGEVILRVAIGSAITQLKHVKALWNLIGQEADKILSYKAGGQ